MRQPTEMVTHPPSTRSPPARSPFKGVLQLPRQVTFSPETRSLVLYPIKEIQSLRNKQVGGRAAAGDESWRWAGRSRRSQLP